MKRTKEHNEKIALSLKGKSKSLSHRHKLSASAKVRNTNPENNPNYRGDAVGYVGIHIWLRKTFGYPKYCESCLTDGKTRNGRWTINWALKKGFKYERKRDNFFGLCSSCHRNYDKTKEWNKNISIAKLIALPH